MINAAIGQPMNEQRISVIGKDDRLVGREEDVELFVAQAMRVLVLRLELHDIHDVNHPGFRNLKESRRAEGAAIKTPVRSPILASSPFKWCLAQAPPATDIVALYRSDSNTF